MTEKQTTKKCPECGNTYLILLRSSNEKICMNHKPKAVVIPWFLDEGQRSLL